MSQSIESAKAPTLDELFNRDPLSLLDQDIDRIIESLRAARDKFAAEEAATVKAPAKKVAAPAQLSIEDLDI